MAARHGTGLRAAMLTLAVLSASARDTATAQTYWRIPAGLGGALAGAGAGWVLDIARWQSTNNDPFAGPSLVMTPIGMGAGGIAGFLAGGAADRRLSRGDSLSRGARAALRIATFLAPVAVGSAATFVIVNPSENARCTPTPDPYTCINQPPPSKAMSDEMVAVLGIGGGAVVGYVLQHRYARALHPAARVGLAPNARGVWVSAALGW